MRSKTILAAAFGLTVFAPLGASALTVPGGTLAAPSDLVLAQASGAKEEDEGTKKGRGERPEREGRQKSEQTQGAPAETKDRQQQRSQEPEKSRRDAPPERGASPERGTQPDRGTPPDRGADKAKQDAEAARREEAGRKARQESDAKAAAEQKARSDAERSRSDAKSKMDDKAAQERGKQGPSQTDERSRQKDERFGRDRDQKDERFGRDKDKDDRFGRDRDKDRDDRFGRDRDKDRDERFGRDKDKDKDDRFGRDRDKDRDDRFGRDKGKDERFGRDRDRDGDRTRRGDRDGRDGRDRDDTRETFRRRDAEKTSRDELSRTRIEEGRRLTIDGGSRTIERRGDRVVIRGSDFDRFGRRDNRRVERLQDGRERVVIVYPDGSQIITITGPRGEIYYRARRDRGGREIVLIREVTRPPLARIDLGPLQLRIPRDQYIVSSRGASRRDIAIALSAPPVEPVERIYSLEEVRSFDRIRDKMRRIDITDITFDTDSAVITEDQAGTLEELAEVINDLIDKNPGESFFIEGHTDAVGSDVYNLALSDRRAEAVAIALTDYFDVPPENLVTQGYGESFLKVQTEEPERENRRVAVRRITPLVSDLKN